MKITNEFDRDAAEHIASKAREMATGWENEYRSTSSSQPRKALAQAWVEAYNKVAAEADTVVKFYQDCLDETPYLDSAEASVLMAMQRGARFSQEFMSHGAEWPLKENGATAYLSDALGGRLVGNGLIVMGALEPGQYPWRNARLTDLGRAVAERLIQQEAANAHQS